MIDDRHPEGATTILVMGILGLVLCAPLGIAAWIQGNSYMQQCRMRGLDPEGTATAGRICGIIASVLMIISILLFVLAFVGMLALGTNMPR